MGFWVFLSDLSSDNSGPHITLQDTRYRPATPSRVRLLVFLYHVCLGCNYLAISNQFGLGKTTVGVCVRDVASAILHYMFKAFVRLPNLDEGQRNSIAWERQTRIPGIMGAIDGSHISIIRPSHGDGNVYYNRKASYSINVQGFNR